MPGLRGRDVLERNWGDLVGRVYELREWDVLGSRGFELLGDVPGRHLRPGPCLPGLRGRDVLEGGGFELHELRGRDALGPCAGERVHELQWRDVLGADGSERVQQLPGWNALEC